MATAIERDYFGLKLREEREYDLSAGTVTTRNFDEGYSLTETADPAKITTLQNARDFEQTAIPGGRAGAIATLQSWAQQGYNTTVTEENNVQITQKLVDRLSVFFDKFADTL